MNGQFSLSQPIKTYFMKYSLRVVSEGGVVYQGASSVLLESIYKTVTLLWFSSEIEFPSDLPAGSSQPSLQTSKPPVPTEVRQKGSEIHCFSSRFRIRSSAVIIITLAERASITLSHPSGLMTTFLDSILVPHPSLPLPFYSLLFCVSVPSFL